MLKQIAIAILALVLVAGGLVLIKGGQIATMIEADQQSGPPPQAVSTAEVTEAVWTPMLRAVGTVRAVRGVMVSAEVPGLVAELEFESGERAKAGQVLVQLDASIEQAQLEAARANAKLAQVTLRRSKRLAAQRINARADLDAAQAEADQTAAQVANLEAQIAKKTIRAPFRGRLGIRQVDLGQVLSAGTPIVSLQNVERVYVDFFLPQHDLRRVAVGQEVDVRADIATDRVWVGTVQSIEPAVDAASRNVQVRAVFDNSDGLLHPGMFAEVRVVLPDGPPQLIVPATSVVYAPYGNSVFVVEDDRPVEPEDEGSAGDELTAPDAITVPGTVGIEGEGLPSVPAKVARQVFVQLGERRGDFVAVESGLSRGQLVVSAGAFKLRNGARVFIDDAPAVEPQVAPKPKDS